MQDEATEATAAAASATKTAAKPKKKKDDSMALLAEGLAGASVKGKKK